VEINTGEFDYMIKFTSDWRIIHWSSVRIVASNDLTRIVGLIPLAGYLILFNDEIAGISSFNTIAGVGEDAVSPFFLGGVSKLRLVFFGSLLVLFSYLIFRAFRPSVLERSNGDLEFSTRVRDSYSVYEVASMEGQIYSDIWKPRTEAFWIFLGSARSREPVVSGYRPDARNTMFAKHSDYIHFLAREWWAGKMQTFRCARLASMFFGITGYILLTIPTLDIAQAVLRDIVSSF
jgi:hypothetical protein